jgi:hypothetical protein
MAVGIAGFVDFEAFVSFACSLEQVQGKGDLLVMEKSRQLQPFLQLDS